MNNNQYWNNRIANEIWKTYNSLEEKNRDLMSMYMEASLDIQEELYKIAMKINNGQVITLSDMHKYNRLTNLKENIENRVKQLGEDVEKFGILNMKEGIKNNYKNIMLALGKTEFDKPNERLIYGLINTEWNAGNYSSRLWKNTQLLASNLNEIITTGLVQGKTVTEMAIQLNNRMNKGFNVAHRLIRTESMKVLNDSSLQAYKDSGVNKIQWWAAEDERMCSICGTRHAEEFSINKAPNLPVHANCRCTYIPVVDLKNGLSSNNEDNDYNYNIQHEKPKLIDKVKDDIILQLNKYEKEIAKDNKKENAIVITSAGDIYHCYGINNMVFPDIDLGDELQNSIITHNHPKNETYYSFSASDLALFFDYNLKELHGIDDKYKYSIKRKENTLYETRENVINKFNTEYYYKVLAEAIEKDYDMDIDGYHLIVSQFAKDYKFDYERIKL